MEHSVDRGTPYDFRGATFDLDDPKDREIVRFVLSQALFGEATGVYCGLSLYSAESLEAAEFYVRQARQELAHLRLFADIFRVLEINSVAASLRGPGTDFRQDAVFLNVVKTKLNDPTMAFLGKHLR